MKRAQAFRASITDRAKNAARKDPSLSVTARLRLFCFQRFLDRLFSDPRTGDGSWALKGATSLLCRLPAARASKDIDIATRNALHGSEQVLREVARRPTLDFLDYRVGTATDLQGPAKGRRLQVAVHCAGKKLADFSIDLVAAVSFPGELELVRPKRAIPMPGMDDVEYPAWPLVDSVADKVAATFELHDGSGSTRHRDLVDLFIIREHGRFDRRELRRSVLSELARRGLAVPREFNVPQPSTWAKAWPKITNRDAPFLSSVSFEDALAAVKQFLDPVLGEEGGGEWDSSTGIWQ
jgi:hypothetical protein